MSGTNTINLESIRRRLRARGLRLTHLKRAVLAEFAKSERPLSAEELAARLEGGGDPSPVYRCLASLEEAGIVSHLYLGDGSRRWALSEEFGGHHDYLVCADCAAIEPLAHCALGDAIAERVGKRGFQTPRPSGDPDGRLLGVPSLGGRGPRRGRGRAMNRNHDPRGAFASHRVGTGHRRSRHAPGGLLEFAFDRHNHRPEARPLRDPLKVVAAENFWGNIAVADRRRQRGGDLHHQ